MAVRRSEADIAHLVGTNALVFSPAYRILNGKTHVVRHVFTSYDNNDRIVRPARWLVNSLFIDGYAFTTPWIGDWAKDPTPRTRRFLMRPPIDCDLYRQNQGSAPGLVPDSTYQFNVLYMGPLLASRFPAASVLGGVRMVLREGFSVRLVVLTSAARTSESQAEAVRVLARQLGVEKNLIVNRVDLDEAQRVQAYNAADVVIFPFVGPVPEKLADPPFALLEAMACEGVVLGTRVLSIPEVVENGKTGFLIQKATALDILQGLRVAFTHRNLGMLGKLAREKILREFGFPKVRKDILAAYKILLDTSHS